MAKRPLEWKDFRTLDQLGTYARLTGLELDHPGFARRARELGVVFVDKDEVKRLIAAAATGLRTLDADASGINTVEDLKAALEVERGGRGNVVSRRAIVRRAREMNQTNLVPAEWLAAHPVGDGRHSETSPTKPTALDQAPAVKALDGAAAPSLDAMGRAVNTGVSVAELRHNPQAREERTLKLQALDRSYAAHPGQAVADDEAFLGAGNDLLATLEHQHGVAAAREQARAAASPDRVAEWTAALKARGVPNVNIPPEAPGNAGLTPSSPVKLDAEGTQAGPLKPFTALDLETMTRAAEIWTGQDQSLPFHKKLSLDDCARIVQGGTPDATGAPAKARTLDVDASDRLTLDADVRSYQAKHPELDYIGALSCIMGATAADVK